MKLLRKIDNKEKEEIITSDIDLKKVLSQIDEKKCPYIIIEDDNGSYLQVAGNPMRLTIEYRDRSSKDIYKHFVVGYTEVDKVWCIIRSGVGDIRVMSNEVLDMNVAEELIRNFIKTSKIMDGFNKRNITKQFR